MTPRPVSTAAIAAARDAGLAVPGDVSVVGYDGIALGGLRTIGLTTVAQPLDEMGTLAAQRLVQRIEHPDHTRFYYPDALVVCHPNPPTDHFQDRPVVVVEVLSDTTRRTDLGEKRDAYLTISSLKVLIFTESENPAATVYRRKSEGGFAVESYTGFDAIIPLPEIEASLPLAELYEQVEFS